MKNLFNKILLPKYANELNVIISDLLDYWKRTNDFSLACMRYLQDLNTKFELGFNPDEISNIVAKIILVSYNSFNLTNPNTIRLFGEFVYYAIFNGKLPCYVRNKKETISWHLENFESYVIQNPTPWNDVIRVVLDRNKFIN